MNFASVAAAGVVPQPGDRPGSSGLGAPGQHAPGVVGHAAPPPAPPQGPDPSLIAKAPGYKPPSAPRTSSPQVIEVSCVKRLCRLYCVSTEQNLTKLRGQIAKY